MENVASIIVRTLYFVAMLCACLGMWMLFRGIALDLDFVQSAGIHSFAIGLAVIPYCIAGCVDRVLLG